MREIPVEAVPLAPYAAALGEERLAAVRADAALTARALRGRTVWNVNSTAGGGGVAELLHALLPLARALGVDARWLVIDGDEEFWATTKRLCTRLYGEPADDGALGPAELAHYRRVTAQNARGLAGFVRPGDVVVVHEAHPAGLVEEAGRLGATVVWRRHTARDEPNEHTREGWAFLRRFVERADATVFLTGSARQDWAPRPHVIPPSIDPCSPKNFELDGGQVVAVLRASGLLSGGGGPVEVAPPLGGPVTVGREVVAVREGGPPDPATPLVVQVSRWDELKDMSGVLRAFLASGGHGAELVLAGADVTGVSDDPDAARFFELCRVEWAALPVEQRRRVHLVCLPMDDLRENAVVVNALQRHAAVVVQKSLAEGFGLTATEAMWKGRPLLASAVGGLREQVVHGESGLLLEDPRDVAGAARLLGDLLSDPALARRLGEGARRRVSERYLPDRHLGDWGRLVRAAVSAEVV
ncbi:MULTISPECIES: glycosyltransferase [Actinosynnema]|uniref:glycosyltransferase n=1 Tax=Actinosynnema TaxID=40566 RepID=UPI0020A584D3|nr:glycosyltransferase [Actinosynnema pretiosum]MCP2098733.1 trehalose synthase [Actinosynnema pretiosum]